MRGVAQLWGDVESAENTVYGQFKGHTDPNDRLSLDNGPNYANIAATLAVQPPDDTWAAFLSD